MSEDYYIGLSREQVQRLLNGETVGKRPYYQDIRFHKYAKKRYEGLIRVHVFMLSDNDAKKEPKAAFNW